MSVEKPIVSVVKEMQEIAKKPINALNMIGITQPHLNPPQMEGFSRATLPICVSWSGLCNSGLVKTLLLFLSLAFFQHTFAQQYIRIDSIPVKVNGNWLKNPWVGGHNYVQLSDIDINFDGIKDLFVFDRTGHKITIYINGGAPNTIDYYDSTAKYASLFPHLEEWVLIRDYNCDGKPDIFTYSIAVAGIKVWRNTSSGGNLQFTLHYPCNLKTKGSM